MMAPILFCPQTDTSGWQSCLITWSTAPRLPKDNTHTHAWATPEKLHAQNSDTHLDVITVKVGILMVAYRKPQDKSNWSHNHHMVSQNKESNSNRHLGQLDPTHEISANLHGWKVAEIKFRKWLRATGLQKWDISLKWHYFLAAANWWGEKYIPGSSCKSQMILSIPRAHFP